MKFCTNCGNRLDDNAKFCPGCGSPVAGSQPIVESPIAEPAPQQVSAGYAGLNENPAGNAAPEDPGKRPYAPHSIKAFIFSLTGVLTIPGFIISLIDVIKFDKKYKHIFSILALVISTLLIASCVIGIVSCTNQTKAKAEAKEAEAWQMLLEAEKEIEAAKTPEPTAAPVVNRTYTVDEVATVLKESMNGTANAPEYNVTTNGNKIFLTLYYTGTGALSTKATQGDADSKTKWSNVIEELRSTSVKMNDLLKDIKTDAVVYIALGNELNKKANIILAAANNGKVVYDYVNGIDLLGIGGTAKSSASSAKSETAPKATTAPKGATVTTEYGEVNKDLKEFLDSYEECIDSLITISKKAMSGDMNALMNYTTLLGKLADFETKAAEWENQNLTGADLKYYTDVLARILKKMANIYQF